MGDALRLTDGTSRTYQSAEMTANAAAANKTRATTVVVKDNGLVATIVARYLTTATAYAQLMVELRINNCIAIERVGI